MPHFNDHQMKYHDRIMLLKRIKSQVTDARTRFVRANTALTGMYCETDDPEEQRQINLCKARLCAIIDTIDGKLLLEVKDD